MISISKTDTIKSEENGCYIIAELRGLSTDNKPTSLGDKTIGNGSIFIEIDTGKIYMYDLEHQTWYEV